MKHEGAPWDVAVILAGGENRRMGTEKALLTVGGTTLVERLLRKLAPHFRRLLVSVAREGPSPLLEQALGRCRREIDGDVAVVADGRGGLGPLEGVRSCLAALPVPRAFFVAVDTPGIHLPLVEELWQRGLRNGSLGCVPRWSGGVEPAYAVYTRDLLPHVERLLEADRRSLQELARVAGVEVLSLEGEVWGLDEVFRNLNTPEEFERWKAEGR